MNYFILHFFALVFASTSAIGEVNTQTRDDKQLQALKDKLILDGTIPLWDGRLLLSLTKKQAPKESDKEKKEKQLNICVSSTNQLGVCTRLSKCKGFKLSTLHNNICFMDIFIPGVCCVRSPPDSPDESSSSSDHSTNENKKKGEVEKIFSPIALNDTAPSADCGIHTIPSSRIINGNESPEGKWPWMAAIYTNSFLGKSFHCGGSLISSRHILTGAHCVKDPRGNTLSASQITVRLGDINVNSLSDFELGEKGRFHRVRKISAHPKFRNINHYFMNDVAILTLSDDVTFTDFVFPICLPSPEAENEPLDKYAGRMSTVTGYGRTELGIPSGKLLEANVPIWKNGDCDASYFAPITEIFICAGYKLGGTDACQGDSGGPLQIEENNRWTQIGITSFGKGCGEAGFPGVYARLGKFIGWIRKNMV